MFFSVESKTGFTGESPEIFDKRGLFYSKKGPTRFNLPAGEYSTERRIYKLGYPIKYKVPRLPINERIKRFPSKLSDIEIIVKEHPHKALIDVDNNKIIFSTEISNYTTPELAAVAFHELGHYFYGTEKYCDLFAMRCLIVVGFNPSQFRAFLNVLSDINPEARERKINAFINARKIEQA